jgi:hypothetical protein
MSVKGETSNPSIQQQIPVDLSNLIEEENFFRQLDKQPEPETISKLNVTDENREEWVKYLASLFKNHLYMYDDLSEYIYNLFSDQDDLTKILLSSKLKLEPTLDINNLVNQYKTKFYTKSCLDFHDKNFCLVESVKARDLDSFKIFVKEGATNFDQALNIAIKNNIYDVFKYILLELDPLKNYDMAFSVAIRYNNRKIINLFYILDKVKNYDLGLINAIKYSRLDDIIYIMNNLRINDYNSIFLTAIKYNNIDIIHYFIENNIEFNYDQALEEARENNEIMNILKSLKKPITPTKSPKKSSNKNPDESKSAKSPKKSSNKNPDESKPIKPTKTKIKIPSKKTNNECEDFKNFPDVNPKTGKGMYKKTYEKYVKKCGEPYKKRQSKSRVSSIPKKTNNECEEFRKFPDVNPKTGKGMYKKTYEKYVEECGEPYKERSKSRVSSISKTPSKNMNQIDKTKLVEGRGGYTVIELKQIAQKNKIDIKGLSKKSDIVSRIKSMMR